LVTVRDIGDPMLLNTVGCDIAYQSLSTQLTAESNRQLTLLGSRLYPRMSQADAGAAIVASLATSTKLSPWALPRRHRTRSSRRSSPTS
jgi:hypothetical protein